VYIFWRGFYSLLKTDHTQPESYALSTCEKRWLFPDTCHEFI